MVHGRFPDGSIESFRSSYTHVKQFIMKQVHYIFIEPQHEKTRICFLCEN